jgi:hypothetical protein
MNQEDNRFDEFLLVEIKRIEIDKWIEGEKIHDDPGPRYVERWISEYAQEFRLQWLNSDCHVCVSAINCGYNLKCQCKSFKKR